MLPRVAVLWGGPSSEAAVSRVSGDGVASALRTAGYEVALVELTPSLPTALIGAEVVFPVTHGRMGEDGCLQGLLEVLGHRYVGSAVKGSACAMDKSTAKTLYRHAGIPVAAERLIREGELRAGLEDELFTELGDVVVKPRSGGSAIGVLRVRQDDGVDALRRAIEAVLTGGDDALVEALVEGAESTCGVLDLGQGPSSLPPTRIVAKAAEFYDYRSKYAAGGSVHLCPTDFPVETNRRIQELALRAHLALGLRDLSRTDVLVPDPARPESLVVLETNTLPGMTPTSLFPEQAAAAGIPFPELCSRLVQQAWRRGAPQPPAAPAIPPPLA